MSQHCASHQHKDPHPVAITRLAFPVTGSAQANIAWLAFVVGMPWPGLVEMQKGLPSRAVLASSMKL